MDSLEDSYSGRLSRKRSFGNNLFFGDLLDEASGMIVEIKFDQNNFPGKDESYVRLLRKRLKLGDVLRVRGTSTDVHHVSSYKKTCACVNCGGPLKFLVIVDEVEVLEAWDVNEHYEAPLINNRSIVKTPNDNDNNTDEENPVRCDINPSPVLSANANTSANNKDKNRDVVDEEATTKENILRSAPNDEVNTHQFVNPTTSIHDNDETLFPRLCKFFVANGQCGRTNCTFIHQSVDKRSYGMWINRRRGVASQQPDDPHENKKAHAERAHVFAEFIRQKYFSQRIHREDKCVRHPCAEPAKPSPRARHEPEEEEVEVEEEEIAPTPRSSGPDGGRAHIRLSSSPSSSTTTSSLSRTPTPIQSIVDVAGGKGDLAFSLWVMHRLAPVLVVDPRPMKASRTMQRRLGVKTIREVQTVLNENIPQFVGLVEDADIQGPQLWVGMHPDQATGTIVEEAIKRGDPFAVVPCCVFSDDFPERKTADGKRVRTYTELIEWIREKDPTNIEVEYLNFTGKNIVVFRR